ncbi:MAG: hypothetical protein KF760_24480 [Candidatus Eremiobacteraeota bacterium]|nr:hypothetical protein [Candidatus Eremiobacteraeota bacterium]MCW5867537.1 hypothetical protein [Candidatus Eremiobacteraeota bacterium]
MSAIREAQRQVIARPTPVSRPEPTRAQPVRIEQPRDQGVELSDRASEILASDRLNDFWSGMLSSPKTASPADPYRSESKQPLEGYDQAKLDNPEHRTPKYIFGRVAQNFKLDSVQGDKAKAGQLLEAMVPELRAAGLEVVGVSGDRIQVKTELGYEWVDVIRGAGAANPGWQWGSEGAGTPEPTATVQEWAAKTGGAGQAAPMGGAAPAGPQAPIVLGKQIDGGKVLGILRKYQPDGQGLTQAVRDPELQKLYPGLMTFGGLSNGKAFNADDRLAKGLNVDKLFFPNGAIVDVIKGAGAAGADWGWMPEN